MEYQNLQQQKEKDIDEIEAEIERAEQIKNAEAAYRNREITAEQLRWFRIITAKSIIPSPSNGQKAETKWNS